MNSTTTKTVLITGAASGIGKACTLKLDQLGFRVFAGVRKLEDGEALKQITSERLTPLLIDITDTKTISAACETVAHLVAKQGLYGLVNNAGIAVGSPVEFIPLEDLRYQLEVNVIGQVAMTQTFLPLIRKTQGRIINIGSVAGRSALPFAAAYCASKSALSAVNDSLRMELQPWGITVVLIEPGSIKTPIWEKSLKRADYLLQKLPKTAFELYGTAFEKAKLAMQREVSRSSTPEQVATLVLKALTAENPKTKYLVGQDAYLRAALNALPDKMQDWLILKQLGLC